ncbi:MAG TPA: hypothetical protein VMS76_11575 [Planctomycetota bacterium]|nr:hypothetical protein [Planctomycetota bacterium]
MLACLLDLLQQHLGDGDPVSAAGPSSSKGFFQPYSVCGESPTIGAKSCAESLERSQESRS